MRFTPAAVVVVSAGGDGTCDDGSGDDGDDGTPGSARPTAGRATSLAPAAAVATTGMGGIAAIGTARCAWAARRRGTGEGGRATTGWAGPCVSKGRHCCAFSPN